MAGCYDTRRYRILIPESYHGTVYIYFGVKDAPPLKMEDGYQLIIVPNDAIVRTSAELISGKLHDEYYLYSDKGRTPLPPQRLGGGATTERSNASGERELYYFFEVF
jgi:hypothetical protein